MKKFIFFGTLLLSSSLYANVGYVPQQLEQFQQSGICLNCDLTDTYLDVKNHIQPPFALEGSNLSGSTLKMKNNSLSDFTRVTANRASFAGNDYSQVSFVNATLVNADFSNSDLSFTNFAGANITGANFNNADLYGSQGIDFSQVASDCNAIMPDGSRGEKKC